MFRETREILAEALGADHPDTITQDRNLGALLFEWAATQPPDLAAPLLAEEARHKQAALDASLRVLGPRHHQTALDRNNSAVRLARDGAMAQARDMMRAAAAARLDLLEPGHPWAVGSLRNYRDWVVQTGGDANAALQTLRDAAATLRQAQRNWGADRLNTLCRTHGVTGATADDLLPALHQAMVVEMKRLMAEGAPAEAYQWVEQQFNDAVHAPSLPPEPGPDFDAALAAALARIDG